MKNREVFRKDPLAWQLLNEGVSSNNSTDLNTLRYELQTFVCDGEYRTGLVRILESYLTSFNSPEQKAVWVSGFYGSGKSHLVKVLRYLWTDTKFADGSTARSISHLPDDVATLLKEVSTLGRKHQGLHAAGGTLKKGVGSVRLRTLGIVFSSLGFPEEYPYAKFLLHLRRDGKLEAFRKAVEKSTKLTFDEELRRLYTSKHVAQAYLELHPHLGSTAQVSATLRAEYPNVADVAIEEMRSLMHLALGNGGKLPCTLIVLDEVQQYISDRAELAHDIQEVTEACSKELGSRVMFIGTGQSALSDSVPALQRLLGRYAIKVHLRDNDVEKVVRTVVLQKSETAKPAIQALVAKHEGEISRQLKATRIGTRSEDHTAYVPDYPLLPVRRRFWERVLHGADPSGLNSQMRTQLRVVHEACRAFADLPLGHVVPADFLYDQIATELVQNGEMQKRFQEVIDDQASKPEGALRRRVCALVFLINKLPRDPGIDIGVRAEAEHLADLLAENLSAGSTELRQQLPGLMRQLVDEGTLMEIEGEYRLQTTEGAAWESEYRKKRTAILSDSPRIDARRTQRFATILDAIFGNLAVRHGACNERRRIQVHAGSDNPPEVDGVTLWVRDGFAETETSILNDIRQRSTDDPTLHLVIRKASADELKQAIAAAEAATETLHYKGNPTTPEGQEARRAIQTRELNENQKAEDLAGTIVRQSRLFLSGGHEQTVIDLKTAVESAAEEVLARLYPKFDLADSPNWPAVLKKARDGSPNALAAVGYSGDAHSHPVAEAILKFIGAGRKGTDVRKQFVAPPYGWPQDAIDAILTVLLVSNHLSARLQGAPLAAADTDQKKLGLAEYRIEHPVLSAAQKIALRKLYSAAGVSARPGDELASASQFLSAAEQAARSAGGDAPAPTAPSLAGLQALSAKSGNDLLQALYEQREVLTAQVAAWSATASSIRVRLPTFHRANDLLAHATEHPGRARWSETLAAIRANRSLLDDPDPVAAVTKELGQALRAAVTAAAGAYASAYAAGLDALGANFMWSKLPADKQRAFLVGAGVQQRLLPALGSDEELLSALQACPLSTWRSHTDALATQFAKALAAAVKELEPKARRITLPAATIRTPAELDAWLAQTRATIETGLKDGPVIL